MAVIYVPRVFGGTIIFTPPASAPVYEKSAVVMRNGKSAVTARNGKSGIIGRTGKSVVTMR